MSVHLTWSVVPTEPTHLGSSGHPFKGLLLSALATEDAAGWEVTQSELMESPRVLFKGSAPAVYLQGALDATTDPDLRETISSFLGFLEAHGALQIGAAS